MPQVRLNARFLDTLKPTGRRVDFFDADEPGLVLRLSEHGRKTWCFLYRAHGSRRLRRLTLGTYPAVTLSDARGLALEHRRGVQIKGENPADVKAAWKQIKSFGELGAWYLKEYAAKRKRSWKEDRRILDKELLPAWRDRKASDVSRADVRALLRSVAERPAPVMANRVLALVSRIYNKALEDDIPGIVMNPALRLPKPGGDEQGRERVLSDAEIRELWAVLEEIKRLKRRSSEDEYVAAISPMIARGLQVLLLTGQRPGEVFRMRWPDVDLDAKWWTLPESATKNRVTHRVPLTDRVVDLLKEAKTDAPRESPWVFAGIKGGSVAARAVKAGADLKRAAKESGERLLSFAFHRHDLRRTCATNMAMAGIPRTTISRVLNHVDRGARATLVYQRYEFDAEKRVALEAWDRRFAQILEPTSAQVLAFQRR
jgi:integrase